MIFQHQILPYISVDDIIKRLSTTYCKDTLIIDRSSSNIYSVKVYIRYLKSLIIIITICELHIVSYNLILAKTRELHIRFVHCRGRGRNLSLIVGHTLYIANFRKGKVWAEVGAAQLNLLSYTNNIIRIVTFCMF